MNLLLDTPLFQELTQEIQQLSRQEEKVEALLRLLNHKFGPVPTDVLTRFQQITEPEILDQLSLAILDAPTFANFCERLPKS